MNNDKGLVFDIQSYSVHDGPGCRTLVFLMGCPLRCEWCANPEGMEFKQRMLYRTTRCKHDSQGCTRCVKGCPQGAITLADDGRTMITDWNRCAACSTLDCTKACLNEARVVCGKWYSVADLMRIFRRDRQYWTGNGGVTFSGGDPLVQREFLLAMLQQCRETYIHAAIETSALFPAQSFLEVFNYVDFAFIDIKHMDSAKHEQKTGVPNEQILGNIAALARSHWDGRLIIRMPVIQDFNDSEENAAATADFLRQTGLKEINILPFHRLGDSKWKQCGMKYPYAEYEATDEQVLQRIQKVYQEKNITCYVGHDTPF